MKKYANGEEVHNTGRSKTVAVVGLGYVGLPLALLADRKHYRVLGLDINEDKIKLLKRRVSPFHDERVARQLLDATIEFDTDETRLKEAEIIVICVPTPVYEDHVPNLEPLEGASRMIAPYLRRGSLVVIESTINPGVSEEIVLPILTKGSGLRAGEFHLSHCPERINPGDKVWTVDTIPRIVGSLEGKGLDKTIRFYESIIDAEIRPMRSLKEAEAVKIVENSFRDVNIAFANELAMSFDKLGIDVVNVIQGAATKPFSFLAHFPGCGVGGHCIPVDPYYLIDYGERNGFNHQFLSMARKINNEMPHFTVDLLEKSLGQRGLDLQGAKIAVLGLSYKANIDDTRESPSFEIIKELKKRGAAPVSYDPHALPFSDVKTLDEATLGASGIIVATAHKEFLGLNPEYLKRRGIEVLVDGRNCLKGEIFIAAGLSYAGIGRPLRFSNKGGTVIGNFGAFTTPSR
ncbi:MAG: nucleotide sugar dehydrogenase [Candidatus Taylorbacteria bacterium]|nr:nucleotide sugar dehydrogenase [Candidatus Taylorbacteria bacterium]